MDTAYKRLVIIMGTIMLTTCTIVLSYSFIRSQWILTDTTDTHKTNINNNIKAHYIGQPKTITHTDHSEQTEEQTEETPATTNEEQPITNNDKETNIISDDMNIEGIVEDTDIPNDTTPETPKTDEYGFTSSTIASSGYTDVGQLHLYYTSGRKDTYPAIKLIVRSQPTTLPKQVCITAYAGDTNEINQTITIPTNDLMSQNCIIITFDNLQDKTIRNIKINDGINITELLTEQ